MFSFPRPHGARSPAGNSTLPVHGGRDIVQKASKDRPKSATTAPDPSPLHKSADLPPRRAVLIQSEGTLSNLAFSALSGFRGHPVAVTSFSLSRSEKAIPSPRPEHLLLLDGSRVIPSWVGHLTPDLTPLPGAGRELDSIRELSPQSVEVVDGASVSPEQLSDAHATEVFMRSYYAHLRALRDSGAALEAAEEDLRQSTGFSHPYYWASFTKFVRQLRGQTMVALIVLKGLILLNCKAAQVGKGVCHIRLGVETTAAPRVAD